MFGASPAACHRAVVHLRTGAPDVPVWLFSTVDPLPETAALCDRIHVRRGSFELLVDAEREAWPYWVALSVGCWTGESGGWPLKLAPLLIPPGRALLQNRAGDFFAGTPAAILRHVVLQVRDGVASAWHRARDLSHSSSDLLGDALRLCRLVGLKVLGTLLGWLGHPHYGAFARMHGAEVLAVTVLDVQGERIALWQPRGPDDRSLSEENLLPVPETWRGWLPLFDDPRTFAVSLQPYFRAWKPSILPAAPFRKLQPDEACQVLAPLSNSILVDRRKLLALGVPKASLSATAWMLLFWKAASAGWRSYSVGQAGRLSEQPDFPMQETAFFLRVLSDSGLRKLGPREPELAGGAIAFAPALHRRAVHPARPKVLLVSPFLPYPLSHGGAVRIYNLCRALAGRVDFILAAIREKHDTVDYARLGEIFREVHVVDVDERESSDTSLPLQVRHQQSRALRALIAELAQVHQPDLLQIEYTHMAAFRDAAPQVPAMLVEHDLTFSLYRQLVETAKTREAQEEYDRWLAFERHWLRAYDAVWTVSEEDRAIAIREGGRARETTFAIANGVDIERFVPSDAGQGSGPREVFYVGSFRHLPNILGFQKLREEVMPRVWRRFPDVRLRVVAGPEHELFWSRFAPKDSLRNLDSRIEIHGFVEDLRPLYGSASVVVIPLEVSAGTNIKVLEAMACGRAVVTTPVGCAGLGLEHGRDVLVSADWEGFAASTCAVIEDAGLRVGVAEQARRTVEQRYSWMAIAELAFESYCATNRAVVTC